MTNAVVRCILTAFLAAAPSLSLSQSDLTVETRVGKYSGSPSEYSPDRWGDARLLGPIGLAYDADGSAIIADSGNAVLRRFPGLGHYGEAPIWVGTPQIYGTEDGWGAFARFRKPWGVARDGAGNVYVTDILAHTIRKVTPEGYVSTLAGSPDQSGNADGLGAAARFHGPRGLAIDASGNLFVADTANHTIRKVGPDGRVVTLAGLAGVSGFANGTGSTARFDRPSSILVEPSGTLLVVDDLNEVVRRVTQDGTVSTFAGTPNSSGSTNGAPGVGKFSTPRAIAADATGLVHVIDLDGFRMRTVSADGVVATLFTAGFGSSTGYNTSIRVGRMAAMAPHPFWGSLMVTDVGNHSLDRLTKEYSGYSLSPVVGSTSSSFTSVRGVAANNLGEIFVADQDGHRIMKVSTDGYAYHFIYSSYSPCAAPLGGIHTGVCGPVDVALGASGLVYVLDRVSVRKFSGSGTLMSVLVGPGAATESGRATPLGFPGGLAVDLAGNVFVADSSYTYSRILKVTPAGEVSVYGGGGYGFADGPGSSARFAAPSDVAVDDFGVVFVLDRGNNRVRRIGTDGVVTTFAGSGTYGYADGPRDVAQFSSPTAILADADGTLLVGDSVRIRRVALDGAVTTVAGDLFAGSWRSGYADGTGTGARFGSVMGLARLGPGQYAIGDYGNQSVRTARKSIPDILIASAPSATLGETINLSPSPGTATSFQWEKLFDSSPTYTGTFTAYGSTATNGFRCNAVGIARIRLRASNSSGSRWSTVDLRCDAPASVRLGDIRVFEGDRGTSRVSVPLTLSSARPETVTVVLSTAADTADSTDYVAFTARPVVFMPGTTSTAVEVDVNGDLEPENAESFRVVVQSTTGLVTIADGTGAVTVLNDDSGGQVSVSVGDTRAPEGYSGSTPLLFPVTLSAPSAGTVSVDYEMTYYYPAVTGTLTFAPGETRKTATVLVSGSSSYSDPNRTISLRLLNPVNALLGDDTGVGTILNDDGSLYGVTDATVTEGTGGSPRYLTFTITRTVPTYDGFLLYRTKGGTATPFVDYVPVSGVARFPAGLQSVAIRVLVFPDADVEPDETMQLELVPMGSIHDMRGTIFDELGVGTIRADDGFLVSIGDKTSHEGDAGATAVNFAVTLSRAPETPVTVSWFTADGSATAPLDYQSATGTVTFATGETTGTITVQVVGDTGEESYENFFVNLHSPTGGASIGDGQGQGTITNTDGSTDKSRLMFHNFVTNRLYRWHIKNGNTLDSYNWVTPWATDPGWTVGAVADFDQDGQLDYLWHNVNDGRLLFWYIDGDNLKGFQFLPYLLGPPWTVATTLDANGDGARDIVYYNRNTGVVRILLHDNATRLGEYDLTQTLPATSSLRVVNAVDANNDGDDELVLYNSATGQIIAWDLAGPTVTSTLAYPDLQTTLVAFNLVSTKTDFNDDGFADFLWHNPSPSGVFSVWFMNGTTREGVGQFQPFTATDPVWRVVGSANIWP
jgi:hypothetical protein